MHHGLSNAHYYKTHFQRWTNQPSLQKKTSLAIKWSLLKWAI